MRKERGEGEEEGRGKEEGERKKVWVRGVGGRIGERKGGKAEGRGK